MVTPGAQIIWHFVTVCWVLYSKFTLSVCCRCPVVELLFFSCLFFWAIICLDQIVFRVPASLLLFSVHPSLSISPFVHPSPWLTNRGAAFQQCPLSKHLYCGVLLALLCQTKPRSQWNNPAGRWPSLGSFGAAGLLQNSRPDSPGPAMIAGQETNFVCACVSAGSKLNPKFTGHAHLFTRQTDFLFFFIQNIVWAKPPARSEMSYICAASLKSFHTVNIIQ